MYKFFIFFLMTLSFSSFADEEMLMKKYNRSLYKISTIDKLTNSSTSYGSGFLMDKEGYLITNYHVISSYVRNQSQNRIEFENAFNKSKGALKVVQFDIVNDLALLKIDTSITSEHFFVVSEKTIQQGNELFSFGNPKGTGITIVKGLYNGIYEKSRRGKINFTGPINSGMSGGPVIDQYENLIGVNVESSGNSVGYLVNAEHVSTLYNNRKSPSLDFDLSISNQVKSWSESTITTIDDLSKFFIVKNAGMISVDFNEYKCSSSGTLELKGTDYELNVHLCNNEENIYIDSKNSLSGISTKSVYVFLEKDKKKNKEDLYSTFRSIYFDENRFLLGANVDKETSCSNNNFIEQNNVVLIKTCISNIKKTGDTFLFTIRTLKKSDHNGLVFNELTLNGLSQEQSIRIAKLYMEKV